MRRIADESGAVGGLEALPFGFLVFVAGTLLLVNAWAVVDAHLAASAAAREAVRTFVESPSEATARSAAELAALETIEGHGRDPARTTITWLGARLVRCQSVTAVVRYDVPTIAVPWIGAFGGGVLQTTARHREVVDPYRSGLAGSDCGG